MYDKMNTYENWSSIILYRYHLPKDSVEMKLCNAYCTILKQSRKTLLREGFLQYMDGPSGITLHYPLGMNAKEFAEAMFIDAQLLFTLFHNP